MDLSDIELIEQSSHIPHEAFFQNPALFYEDGLLDDFDYDDPDYLDHDFPPYFEDDDDDLARELFGEGTDTDDSQSVDIDDRHFHDEEYDYEDDDNVSVLIASPQTTASSSSLSDPSQSSQSQPSSSSQESDPTLDSQQPSSVSASGLPPLHPHPHPFPEDPLDQHFLRLQRVTNSLIASSPGQNSPRLDSLRRRIDQHFDGRVNNHAATRTGAQADRSGERELAERLQESMDRGRAAARRRTHDQFVDDELVEMEVEPRQRSRQHAQGRATSSGQQTVIDLTEEPDSPDQSHRSLPRPGQAATSAAASSRNPRRQASQRRQTPAFTRSDGSILGGSVATAAPGGRRGGGGSVAPADFIDLTEDSPDEARNPSESRHRRNLDPPRRDAAMDAEVAIMGVFARFNSELPFGNLSPFGTPFGRLLNLLPRANNPDRRRPNNPADIEVQIIGHQQGPFAAAMDNPLAGNPVNFDYQAVGFGNHNHHHHHAQPPKPPHVPPPAPREGFTRDTGPDTVVICPSCDEELKYDPDEHDEDGPPTKKARTRKDREEHHFWAVPACGHVYCRRCFEHRRNCIPPKKAKAPEALPKVGFRPGSKPNQVLCAVDDCNSEVSNKKSWVGIFL